MKDARGTIVLRDEAGIPYALHLKADYTAEHEMEPGALEVLLRTPGLDTDGIARYSMTTDGLKLATHAMQFFEKVASWTVYDPASGKSERKRGKVTCLRLGHHLAFEKKIYGGLYLSSREETISAAYSSRAFEVVAKHYFGIFR